MILLNFHVIIGLRNRSADDKWERIFLFERAIRKALPGLQRFHCLYVVISIARTEIENN